MHFKVTEDAGRWETEQREPRSPPPSQGPYLLQAAVAALRLGPRGRPLGHGALRVGLHLRHGGGAGLRHLSAGGRTDRGKGRGGDGVG